MVARERQPVVGEQLFDLLVGELGPLELEEQELGADAVARSSTRCIRAPRADRSVSVANSSPA